MKIDWTKFLTTAYDSHNKLSTLGKIAMSPYPYVTSGRRFLSKIFPDDYSQQQQKGDRF